MTVPQQEAIAPVPFFTDTRTLAQKLAADEREWRPHEPEYECPNMILGLVLERGQYYSDFKDAAGENKVHETARVLTEDNIVCLKLAGLPETVQMHELRHSAADNLWRQTGNMTLAQQLLRHESPSTTAGYLHPTRDDLAAALASLRQVVSSGEGERTESSGFADPNLT